MEQKMGSKVNPMEFYTVNDISRILQHTNMNVRKKLKDGGLRNRNLTKGCMI